MFLINNSTVSEIKLIHLWAPYSDSEVVILVITVLRSQP